MTSNNLQEIALENDASEFAEAVLPMFKAPEAELPAPHHFHDIKEHRRTALRLIWWRSATIQAGSLLAWMVALIFGVVVA